MKKFYSLLIAISAATVAMAQPTLPPAPATCSANQCLTNSSIDVCPPVGNTVISSFNGGQYNRGGTGSPAARQLSAGAVWRFRNMATVNSVTINAEITIDAIFQADLDAMDDNSAVDQNNQSIASWFAPRIGPDQNLNGNNRRGYVQFTIAFYRNASGANNNSDADFANTVNLLNINYVHYDVDGNDANGTNNNQAPGSWFRETGVAKRISPTNPMVLANASTELVSYSYSDAGSTTWAGFAGTICERDDLARCAQIASSFSYTGALSSITFRLGYDYNAGSNVGSPVRQYGTRLGCFNFPDQVTLPVKLLGFSASYNNGQTTLSWQTENEVNFDHYEIERSANGKDFIAVGTKHATGSYSKTAYQHADDISSTSEKAFYYRLRMVDVDGKFSYSNTILIRKDQVGGVKGLLLSPNPVASGSALTLRVNAESRKNVEVRVLDVTGKLILKQQNQLNEGLNSVSINNNSRLQPGIYTVQVIADDEVLSSKLSVIR